MITHLEFVVRSIVRHIAQHPVHMEQRESKTAAGICVIILAKLTVRQEHRKVTPEGAEARPKTVAETRLATILTRLVVHHRLANRDVLAELTLALMGVEDTEPAVNLVHRHLLLVQAVLLEGDVAQDLVIYLLVQ